MAQIAGTIADGSHLAFRKGFSNSVSAGKLIYSPYEKHLFPSLGQKKASEGVFGGGSHLPENEGWLPGDSAGQRIYSPMLATTLVASRWLPTGYHPRSLISRTWRHELSPDGQHGMRRTGFRGLQQ